MTVHVGEYGFTVSFTIKDTNNNVFPIDDATTQELIFEKPGEDKVNKTTNFVTDGTDGRIIYTVEDGLIDDDGIWNIQGHIIGPTYNHYTTIVSMQVDAVL